ncbi:MAG: tRNA dihydrouridine synthase DusB [Candidatus Omnitrophota bacterium]
MKKDGVKLMQEARCVLSPMAGVTDIPFRIMCRRYGCRFAFTEMVDVNGMAYRNIKTMKYLDMVEEDSPLGAQIVGADENKMLEAAKICQDRGFRVIDINAGCPARKVIKVGKGSALLKDPVKLGRIIGLLARKLETPVTVKIRAGWDEESINYLEVSRIAESEGASAICVHPRTMTQMYKGAAISHEPTKEVKQAVKIPVFASGNIFSAADAASVLKYTGCDGIFVARGALGHPWIFSDIAKAFSGDIHEDEPGFDRIKLIMAEHFKLSEEHRGELMTTKRMYKHVSWYLKRYKNLNEVMNAYREVNDTVSFLSFLERITLDGRKMVIQPK